MADVTIQLIQTMTEELQMQRDLEIILNNKLDAMQRRDLSRMEVLFSQEQKLVNRLRLNNQKRTLAVRKVVKQFLPEQSPNTVSARELAWKSPRIAKEAEKPRQFDVGISSISTTVGSRVVDNKEIIPVGSGYKPEDIL